MLAPGNEIGHRNADVLVKVRLKIGADQVLLCHMELQTNIDPTLGKRSFVYAYRIFDKFDHFPLTILLLADEDETFRPSIFELRPTDLAGLRLEFLVIKTLDYLPGLQELKNSTNLLPQVIGVYLDLNPYKPSSNPLPHKMECI